MSNQETQHLEELAKVLNDGVDFYREAVRKTDHSALRTTFERLANQREQLLSRLQPHIVMREGEPEQGHTLSGKARQIYARVLGAMQKDSEHTYISNLEEVEDKTLEAMREAIESAKNIDIIGTLNEFYPLFKQSHDEMSRLQKVTS